MSRSDRELLQDASAHLLILRGHLGARGLDDQTVADAVSLRLAAAIESLAQCSDDVRTRLFGDDWPLMWATRNRIAHGYAFIDPVNPFAKPTLRTRTPQHSPTC